MEQATFAAGCFWGVEAAFRQVPGVLSTSVGYTGGTSEAPTYEQVCAGRTGHAEAVRISFDPVRVSYAELLDVFWDKHNPRSRNRQGFDIGSQYRSAIFYHDEHQREVALESKASLGRRSPRLRGRIKTEIVPAGRYFPAEDYHQQYLEKHGRSRSALQA